MLACRLAITKIPQEFYPGAQKLMWKSGEETLRKDQMEVGMGLVIKCETVYWERSWSGSDGAATLMQDTGAGRWNPITSANARRSCRRNQQLGVDTSIEKSRWQTLVSSCNNDESVSRNGQNTHLRSHGSQHGLELGQPIARLPGDGRRLRARERVHPEPVRADVLLVLAQQSARG